MEYQLAPSILAADFCHLGAAIEKVEQAGVKWLHIDIMDCSLFLQSLWERLFLLL